MPGLTRLTHTWRRQISSLPDCTYLPNTNMYLPTGVTIYRNGPKRTEVDWENTETDFKEYEHGPGRA